MANIFNSIVKSLTIVLCFLILKYKAYSQSDNIIQSKHQLGIDITNTLTFLKKNNQSYLLNYKYYLSKYKYAIRGGLNLELSTGESEGYYPDLKIGIQKNKFDEKWNRYYGFDISYSYFKSNIIDILTQRFGISPFVGVEHFFNKRISFSTEAALNFNYFVINYLKTFEPIKMKTYSNINIGYVGMFVVSYHF